MCDSGAPLFSQRTRAAATSSTRACISTRSQKARWTTLSSRHRARARACQLVPLLTPFDRNHPCPPKRSRGPFALALWLHLLGCRAGFFGDTTAPTEQNSPRCSAECPGGMSCVEGTSVPTVCTRGFYCEPGSPLPTPCSPGALTLNFDLAPSLTLALAFVECAPQARMVRTQG